MPVFNQSSLSWANAVAKVADVIGASADVPMLGRAHDALRSATQRWANYYPWSWLQATATVTASSNGDVILPTGFRTLYDLIYAGSPLRLYYMEPRLYDQLRPNDESATPTHYTLFNVGATGMMRLIPPPGAQATATIRYWRRMQMGTSYSATSVTADVPEDYEAGWLALAKWYFLVDKGGEAERAAALKEEGLLSLNQARSAEQFQPDQAGGFLPGYLMENIGWNPDSTWEYFR